MSRKRPRTVRWTVEMEVNLAEMWREHECLFNTSLEEFHNRDKREEEIRLIASSLNIGKVH